MAHVFCLAESIFRSADLIVEFAERNQGTETQSSGCVCVTMEGLKVAL